MAKYKLLFTETFYRNLKSIPAKDIKRVLSRTKQLADDPRSQGCQKLSGRPDRYRIRQGDYRIIYSIEDERVAIVIVKVGRRRDVYGR